MPVGRIKKIVEEKGFGFIRPDDGGSDVFLHHSVVANKGFDNLKEGQEVEYELAPKDDKAKGPKASSVEPV